MIFMNLKRIARVGFVSFWRNWFVSLTSILVMTMTLFVIGSVIFIGAVLDSTVEQIKSKVDVMAEATQYGQIALMTKSCRYMNHNEARNPIIVNQETA